MTRIACLVCLAALTTAPLLIAPALAQFDGDPVIIQSGKVAGLLDVNTPQARLIMSEQDHGVGNMWIIGLGEEFADGWRLAGVTQAGYSLRKGDETRLMSLNMVPSAAPTNRAVASLTPAPATPSGRGAPTPNLNASALASAPQPGGGRGGAPAAGGNFGQFQGGRGLNAPAAPAGASPPQTRVIQLPPGVQLPAGINLPPGVTIQQTLPASPDGAPPRPVVITPGGNGAFTIQRQPQ